MQTKNIAPSSTGEKTINLKGPTKAKPKIQDIGTLAQRAKIRAKSTQNRAERVKSRAENLAVQTQVANAKPKTINKEKAEAMARKAEKEAIVADQKAEWAEILAKRAQTKAEALTHKARIEANKAEECARQAETYIEAWGKFISSKAEAEVKREKAQAKAIEAKLKGNTECVEEVSKARKEAHKLESEAKKAKIIAEKAADADIIKTKHIEAAVKAEVQANAWIREARDRMAEAIARKAEANAKRAEAKARRQGDELKAEAKKAEALSKKSEAIAKGAEIDLIRIEKKAQTQARAKEVLKAPSPPRMGKLAEKQTRLVEKKHLSLPGLLEQVRKTFSDVPEQQVNRGPKSEIRMVDCLMSGLAIFSLKYASLLQFENDSKEGGPIHHNLKTLYKIERVPSDTYLRERLDVVDPNFVRPVFKKLFSSVQRGKELEQYVFYEGYYLASGDATGYFSSKDIHCGDCCKKEHQDGTVTYYHQMMSAAIVHPDHATVIPLCPEPIIKADGTTKNDCERNASERLYRHIRREHPHLRLIITEDALGSNGPHISLLKELDMRFIIVAKPDGNKSLFEFLNGVARQECNYSDDRYNYKIQYVNDIPLNDTHSELFVNFIEAWVYNAEGELEYHNTWITDIFVTEKNAYHLFRGGRAKWKIENETFNTLKNQDYHFEHNYGHGYKHLATVLMYLMVLAFFIDQIQQSCCGLFQAAWEKMKSKIHLWSRLKAYFTTYYIDSWEQLWRAIAYGHVKALSISVDTS